jgi:hypothetical protein
LQLIGQDIVSSLSAIQLDCPPVSTDPGQMTVTIDGAEPARDTWFVRQSWLQLKTPLTTAASFEMTYWCQ